MKKNKYKKNENENLNDDKNNLDKNFVEKFHEFDSNNNYAEKSEEIKQNFFKKRNRLKKLVSSKEKINEKIDDKLGYFKTNLGIISVGYDKFKRNSSFGFTLLSEKSEIKNKNITKRDFKDKHNYFKKDFNNTEEKMKFSNIGFEYNAKQKIIKQIGGNEHKSSNKEFLYKENEESKLVKILRQKKKEGLVKNSEFENALSDFYEIKKEKKEDNDYIKNKIKNFVELFKKNKLKKYEDSDEIKKSKFRIIEMSFGDNILYLLLKKKIEEYIKKGKAKNVEEALRLIDKTNINNKILNKIIKHF
ncbi:MAG: hypothetical protein CfP315_0722 [Candidatus Improbicoccus pseudotrichonymphae]|uniref:Uncharacterized protein n=1 Tax=Candidatus Improbicoccus pseudotrichonymphae TaxID=3033792 RepID=A0AA48HVI1_9FIRM|nr:MAG: hypothetical protein CfP315_0722 [Candidatus Improbicoccus pseudotrichonymphae]